MVELESSTAGDKFRFRPQFTVRDDEAGRHQEAQRRLDWILDAFLPPPVPALQAVILTNDDDNSLYPLTNELPKSLLPVANRPILKYQLDLLSSSGFTGTEVIIPMQ